jgi:hypothetical protein
MYVIAQAYPDSMKPASVDDRIEAKVCKNSDLLQETCFLENVKMVLMEDLQVLKLLSH